MEGKEIRINTAPTVTEGWFCAPLDILTFCLTLQGMIGLGQDRITYFNWRDRQHSPSPTAGPIQD